MNHNRIGGTAFALWGLLHVVVGLAGLTVYVTGGTEPMLAFVNLDAAVNAEATRMSNLVAEFYQALLLIGLTVTVVGLTLNRAGEPLGLYLNTVLVAGIDAFFVWFEVIPGHRPVVLAVISLGLFAVGVGFCWRGLGREVGSPAGGAGART